jgi:hypothetical protein
MLRMIIIFVLFAGALGSAQDTYTMVKKTDSKPSGSGAGWSPWYSITSDPPKPGFIVATSSFALEGDRRCGAWAECSQTFKGPASVVWQFRLQGHNEGPPSVRNSVGVLTVTYQKAPLPPTYTTVKRTASMPSGDGAAWSPRYQISSDPPQAGYIVADSTFLLEGDRKCGSWAECYQIQKDPLAATWEFRLQGHNEGSPGVRNSTGVLTVTYQKGALPVTFKRDFWSAEKWSGRGKDFGCGDSADTSTNAWCTVSAAAPPAGYAITAVKFTLVGDRPCSGSDQQPSGVGSWAECQQQGTNKSVWRFRMQGHDESSELKSVFVQVTRSDGGQTSYSGNFDIQKKAATSRGLLSVTYQKMP